MMDGFKDWVLYKPPKKSFLDTLKTPNSHPIFPSYNSLITLPNHVTSSSPQVKKHTKRDIIIPCTHAHEPLGVQLCLVRGRLMISHVREGSIAWNLGLHPGDRIDSINNRPPGKPVHFINTFRNCTGEVVLGISDCPVERVHIHSPIPITFGIVYSGLKIVAIHNESAAKLAMLDLLKNTHSIVAIDSELVLGWVSDKVVERLECVWGKSYDVRLSLVPYEMACEMARAFCVQMNRFGV